MSYIDTLLQKRNITEATPFWKLHIHEDELKGLIDYISHILDTTTFDFMSASQRKKTYRLFDREACLMYALWWSQKYDGGKQSWDEPLADFGINIKYLETVKEAVLNELKIYRRLRITIFRSEANHRMFLQSILAQGGLPMQLMNGDTTSSFENFLYNLISEYEDMDSRDWSNISVAEKLADRYINNKTLRESEAVLDFAMEIVKAYVNNDDAVFCNYEEIKNIIAHIREKRGIVSKQDRKLFKVNWEFKVSGNKLELFYSLTIPYEVIIDEKAIGENAIEGDASNVVNIYSYYIDGYLVGSYHRQGNRFLLMPGTAMNQRKRWNRQQNGINLKRNARGELIDDRSLINSEPPYMGEPILIQYKSGYWIPKRLKNNNAYACLIPCNWKCDELSDYQEYDFNGSLYSWADLDWNSIRRNQLQFTELNTDEKIVLDNSISNFAVSFSPILPVWIEETSTAVAVDIDDFRNCFECFKDDKSCPKTDFKFMFKSTQNSEYKIYSSGKLPFGPIIMKVFYPSDGQSKTFSFYNIFGLHSGRVSNDTLEIRFSQGKYALLANQNIKKLCEDQYQSTNTTNLKDFAPIRFRLYPTDIDKTIDIGLTTPLQKSCFIDNQGNILNKDFPVAMSELYKYKINLSDSSRIVISYWEITDGRETCITRKQIHMKHGRYPLDILKDDIDRFVCINGFNDFCKHITVKISNTGAELCVRRNAYRAQQCQDATGNKGIFVTRNEEPASGLLLFAIAINATEESPLFHKYDIQLLESEEVGKYFLPELEDTVIKEFVVFSDNNQGEENMLAFFLNLGEDMDKESRDANKRESINRIQQALLQEDEGEWENAWFYMDLVIKYRLSYFNTFNTFFAIVNSPYLVASLLVRIYSSQLMNVYDENTIIEELQRMERELSFGFHYIPSACWKKEYERVGNLYDNRIELNPILKAALGERDDYIFKKFHLLEELLKRQFGENEPNLIPMIYRLLGFPWSNKPSFLPQVQGYLIKVNGALDDFDKLYTPGDLKFARVECHTLRPWDRYHLNEIMQKMLYLAIVLPQCAAQYVHSANMELWDYQKDSTSNEFIRRMTNYMCRYASVAYNELFITSLLRDPVNQDNN